MRRLARILLLRPRKLTGHHPVDDACVHLYTSINTTEKRPMSCLPTNPNSTAAPYKPSKMA